MGILNHWENSSDFSLPTLPPTPSFCDPLPASYTHCLAGASSYQPGRAGLLNFQEFRESSDFPLVTWNCPCWKYLLHGNPETNQDSSPICKMVKHSLAHQGTRVFLPPPSPPHRALPSSHGPGTGLTPYPHLQIQLTVRTTQIKSHAMFRFFSLGEWLTARSPILLAGTLVFVMNSTCWAHPLCLGG